MERVLDFQRHGLNQALLLRDLLRGQTHGSSSGHPERAAARADERLCVTGVSGPGQTWSTRRLRGQRWWPGWGRSRRVSRAGCVCGWRCEVRGLTWDSPYIHFPHGASESITSESTPRAGPTGSYTPMGLGMYQVLALCGFSHSSLQRPEATTVAAATVSPRGTQGSQGVRCQLKVTHTVRAGPGWSPAVPALLASGRKAPTQEASCVSPNPWGLLLFFVFPSVGSSSFGQMVTSSPVQVHFLLGKGC